MKTILFLLVLVFTTISAIAEPIVEDNFNSYSDGSIVGQGDWKGYRNGNNFLVQGGTVFEGSKALYVGSSLESVIGKQASISRAGTQTFYIKTENRNSWASGGYASVELHRGTWIPPQGGFLEEFVSIMFKKDGRVFEYDSQDIAIATFQDNVWNSVEVEWYTPYSWDQGMARYQINGGGWTNWRNFYGSSSWQGFDYVGLCLYNGGSGGVYFDALGAGPIPEPSTFVLLAIGLVVCGFFFLHRKK